MVGLIDALGVERVRVVGHDWGGVLAWTVATLHPGLVSRLGVVGMPHPLRLRSALVRDGAQLRASSYIGLFQLPRLPENRLRRYGGAYVGDLLRRWGGPGFPDGETEARCREAMQIPSVAHCSLEWYRWAIRSLTRPSGVRFQRQLAAGVGVPTAQVHGALDTCVLASTAYGSGEWVRAPYELHVLDGVGHFCHQEAPEVVTSALLDLLAA